MVLLIFIANILQDGNNDFELRHNLKAGADTTKSNVILYEFNKQ